MDEERWSQLEGYIDGLLLGADPALEAALESSAAAGLPPIQVSPGLGKLLHLLARGCGARRILEAGTLGGYSTIWLARALPRGGRLVTLEANAAHAEVARANLESAGLAGSVEVRLGRAAESMAALVDEGAGPFDLVFIDADKSGYPDYLEWSLRLTAPGSLIVADNVVRRVSTDGAGPADPDTAGIRRFLEMLGAERRLDATVVQTVGSKGHDGFALAVVVEPAPAG